MKLLNTNNKLLKSFKMGYLSVGLSLAPSDYSGFNVCPQSTQSCRNNCIGYFTGHNVMAHTRNKQLWRTKLYRKNKRQFVRLVMQDLLELVTNADKQGLIPLFRPNTYSDLPFELTCPEILNVVQCIDYTKIERRMKSFMRGWDYNYELTYSVSEKSNTNFIKSVMDNGFNTAVVFDTKYLPAHGIVDRLPEDYKFGRSYYTVIDGDEHDVRLRSIDGYGVIVGLRFKGSAERKVQAIKAGFCKKV